MGAFVLYLVAARGSYHSTIRSRPVVLLMSQSREQTFFLNGAVCLATRFFAMPIGAYLLQSILLCLSLCHYIILDTLLHMVLPVWRREKPVVGIAVEWWTYAALPMHFVRHCLLLFIYFLLVPAISWKVVAVSAFIHDGFWSNLSFVLPSK